MAGILTSVIKQSVSARRGDARSPAADGKVSTVKPSDRMSLLIEARKKSSSSTIETNGALGMRPPGVLRATRLISDNAAAARFVP
jgi:hypothetical protein